MSRFACPTCGAHFEVAAEHLGRTVRCPGCGQPAATAPPPPSPFAPPGAGPMAQPPPGMAPYYYPPPPPPRLPNPAGVGSFLCGLAYWVFACGFGVWAATQTSGGATGFGEGFREGMEVVQQATWLPAVRMVFTLVAMVGLGLGIYAVSRENRKKGLAIAGVVICSISSLCGLTALITGG